MDWLRPLARLAKALAGPLISRGRHLARERAAAERPSAVIDHADGILDAALRRLGTLEATDPWWSRAVVEGEGWVVRPAEFQKPHVRDWLSQHPVRRMLKAQARARAVGAPASASDYQSLVASHMQASLEDRQHAESVVVAAIAFLRTSLQIDSKDPGTVAVVQAASGEQHRRFDAVDERLDAIARAASLGADRGMPAERDPLAALAILRRHWRADSSPPAALLRAEFGIVPFTGRASEMGRVDGWLAQGATVAAALVTGPGGRGKTRLAIEIATRAAADGWRAGFVSEASLQPLIEAARSAGRVLVVVDYAEDDPRHLVEALQAAAGLPQAPGQALRVLLLARNAGEWWERVQSSGGVVADLTHHPGTFLRLRLAELAGRESEAPMLLDLARAAFREALQTAAPAVQRQAAPCSREALLIFAQALLLELGEPGEAQAEDAVLQYMLSRERGFWQRALDRYGLAASHARLFEMLVAVVTLAGGAHDAAETDRLFAGFAAHFRLDVRTSEALRLVLVAVYGSGTRIEPLQPDRLGELLVATHAQPEVLALASFREQV